MTAERLTARSTDSSSNKQGNSCTPDLAFLRVGMLDVLETPRKSKWPSACFSTREAQIMLGWMIVFALMALPGAAATMSGYGAATSVKTISVICAFLFVISVLTQIARGKVR